MKIRNFILKIAIVFVAIISIFAVVNSATPKNKNEDTTANEVTQTSQTQSTATNRELEETWLDTLAAADESHPAKLENVEKVMFINDPNDLLLDEYNLNVSFDTPDSTDAAGLKYYFVDENSIQDNVLVIYNDSLDGKIIAPTNTEELFSGYRPQLDYLSKDIYFNDVITNRASDKVNFIFANTDGSVINTVTVSVGQNASRPEDPTKDEYLFAGWYTTRDLTTPYNFATLVYTETTIYARWVKAKQDFTFAEADGTVIKQVTVNYGQNASRPEDPTKPEYLFAGWYTTPELTTEYNFATNVTSATIVYARWVKEKQDITFAEVDGTVIYARTVIYGNSPSRPADPTKADYLFAGWYTTPELTTEFNFATLIYSSTIVYARWVKAIQDVKFVHPDGTVIYERTVNYGHSVTRPQDPTKDGYIFAGWYTSTQFKTEYDFETKIYQTRIIYAKWSTPRVEFTFAETDGTVINKVSVGYGLNASRPEDPTKDGGFIFAGWYTTPELETEYDFGTRVTDPTTIYARWVSDKVEVTFANPDGTVIKKVTVGYGLNASRPESPTKVGHTFDGWYTTPELTKKYDFGTLIYHAKTIYAKWVPNRIEFTFANPDGTVINKVTVGYGLNASRPTNPTKTGHTFDGWYTTSDLTTVYNFATLITEPKTIYAKWIPDRIDFIFANPDGTEIRKVTVDYGRNASRPTEHPTKVGYEFAGWYTTPELTTEYDFGTKIYTATTIYARWKANRYTLSFNTNDGSVINSIDVFYETLVNDPGTPTKEGYSFAGWYKESGFTTLITIGTYAYDLTENTTFYAKWNAKSYTLNFNTNDGSSITSIGVTYGVVVTDPGIPTKTGYTFGGWYKESGFTTLITIGTYTYDIDGDTTFYAKWNAKSYSLSFDTNGGSAVDPIGVTYGALVANPGTPTKAGFTFAGWYKESGLTTLVTIGTYTYDIDGSTTFYAKWTTKAYVLTFDGNYIGSVNTSQNLDDGDLINDPGALTRTGYSFDGWYLDAEGNGNKIVFDNNLIFNFSENTTFYAKWIPNKVKVTFTDGSTTYIAIDVDYDTTVAKPTDPTKAGYTFDAWVKSHGGSDEFDFTTTITNPITLYAKWTVNSYDLTFDENYTGGSTTKHTLNYGDAITEPTDPTRTGYSFDGWYLNTNGTGTAIDFLNLKFEYTENTTFFAKWTLESYTLTFDENYTGATTTDHTLSYGATITKPTDPTRVGYTFEGWYLVDDGNGTEIDFEGLTYDYEENKTFYAKWSAKEYVLTFDDNYTGGTKTTQDIAYDATITEPTTDPTRVGYEFDAWYLDANGTTVVNFTDLKFKYTENTTFYAKWNAIEYTLTFDENYTGGSTTNTQIDYDATITKPATDPTRTGYNFDGWYLVEDGNGTEVDFTDLKFHFTEDTTFYAKWTGKEYKVTFDDGFGTVTTGKVIYNENVIAPTPTREGYIFAEWYDAADNLMNFGTYLYDVDGDSTYTAKWTVLEYSETLNSDPNITLSSTAVAGKVTHDTQYDLTLTIADLHHLVSITIVMNGKTLTADDYSVNGNVYTIAKVTGDIIVTVVSKSDKEAAKEELEDYYEDLLEKNPNLSDEEKNKLEEALEAAKDKVDEAGSKEEIEQAVTDGKGTADKVVTDSAKEDAKEQLEDYYNDLLGKNPNLSDEEKNKLEEALEAAKDNVDAATTPEDAAGAVQPGKDAMNDIILDAEKEDAKEDLDDYYEDLLEKNPNLSDEEKKELEEALNDAKDKIDNATSSDQIDKEVQNVKDTMDNVIFNGWDILPLIIAILVMMLGLLIVTIAGRNIRNKRISMGE